MILKGGPLTILGHPLRSPRAWYVLDATALIAFGIFLYTFLAGSGTRAIDPNAVLVIAASDTTTTLNIFAPHSSNCEPEKDYIFVAGGARYGTTNALPTEVILDATAYVECRGRSVSGVKVTYSPKYRRSGEDAVVVRVRNKKTREIIGLYNFRVIIR